MKSPRNAKLFGTRQSRWTTWGVQVRQFPHVRAFFVAQPTPHRRTPPGATTPNEPFWQVRGGGKVRFLRISGFPRKFGVSTVTGGYHHVHKLVARQTGVSLESLSEVCA